MKIEIKGKLIGKGSFIKKQYVGSKKIVTVRIEIDEETFNLLEENQSKALSFMSHEEYDSLFRETEVNFMLDLDLDSIIDKRVKILEGKIEKIKTHYEKVSLPESNYEICEECYMPCIRRKDIKKIYCGKDKWIPYYYDESRKAHIVKLDGKTYRYSDSYGKGFTIEDLDEYYKEEEEKIEKEKNEKVLPESKYEYCDYCSNACIKPKYIKKRNCRGSDREEWIPYYGDESLQAYIVGLDGLSINSCGKGYTIEDLDRYYDEHYSKNFEKCKYQICQRCDPNCIKRKEDHMRSDCLHSDGIVEWCDIKGSEIKAYAPYYIRLRSKGRVCLCTNEITPEKVDELYKKIDNGEIFKYY